MNFYQDMVEGLKRMIGPGKKFSNPTQMAKACGVAPNQIIRYIRQERGKHIQVVARVLDTVGARIVFPDFDGDEPRTEFQPIREARSRTDETGTNLLYVENNSSPLSFSQSWLAEKGDPDKMRLVNVTGNSMSPRIEDGDTIIIDLSQTELYEGRIYAIRIDRDVVVRRIAKEPGKIALVCDNTDVGSRRIELDIADESSGWATIGRVIFVAKDLP